MQIALNTQIVEWYGLKIARMNDARVEPVIYLFAGACQWLFTGLNA